MTCWATPAAFSAGDNLVGSFRIDLTDDTVSGGCKPVFGFPPTATRPAGRAGRPYAPAGTPLHAGRFLQPIPPPEPALLYDSGIYSVRKPYLFLLEGKGYAWLRVYAELNRDPKTGHIIAPTAWTSTASSAWRRSAKSSSPPSTPAWACWTLTPAGISLPHRPRALRHGGGRCRLPQLRGRYAP